MPSQTELIAQLTGELKPVKRLWDPNLRFITWLAASVGVVVAIMLFIQSFRADFSSQLLNFRFLIETALAVLPTLTLSWVVLRRSVPGLSAPKWLVPATVAAVVLSLGSLFLGHFGHAATEVSMAGKRPTCLIEVLTLSWIPIAALSFLVLKGYARHSSAMWFCIGLAGASLPMALMQVACMYVPFHNLVFHFLPALVVAAISVGIGSIVSRFST